jgi:hypothetical protein
MWPVLFFLRLFQQNVLVHESRHPAFSGRQPQGSRLLLPVCAALEPTLSNEGKYDLFLREILLLLPKPLGDLKSLLRRN